MRFNVELCCSFFLGFCARNSNYPASLNIVPRGWLLLPLQHLSSHFFQESILLESFMSGKSATACAANTVPLLGELHRNKNDTPTMGGVLILFSLLISLLLWMDLQNSFTLILFLTTLVMGALGGLDDYLKLRYKNKKGIKGKRKLIIQGSFSLFIALYLLWNPLTECVQLGNWFSPPTAKSGAVELSVREYATRLYVPFFKEHALNFSGIGLALMVFLILCVITGASNAVNLTDGLDGLATGTVMLASGAFSLIAFVSNNLDLSSYLNILYIEGSSEIAIYLAAVCGACLGFLWYNSHPAQVFMGDTGSLTLGAILGVSAVLLKRELLLSIIGGVFVMEALSVMLQVGSYKFRKKSVFFCALHCIIILNIKDGQKQKW